MTALNVNDDPAMCASGFASEFLGLNPYDWQVEVLEWLDDVGLRVVKGALCTPNGSGKSSVVLPTSVLWWLSVFPLGKVVCTTKDGKQLDSQLIPALKIHASKFPGWNFLEREIRTPTGGRMISFTTNDPARAEGHHKISDLDGPLLIIVDEAKSVEEEIFQAIDRCTYNALLYTSSPGRMGGSFYDAMTKPELGFLRRQVGLADCPHIPPDRIATVIAKYGPESAFTRSTLHGEFMVADGETRFDRDGLEYLRTRAGMEYQKGRIGRIEQHEDRFAFIPDPGGWVWMIESVDERRSYLGICDPMTGKQSEGSKKRDCHACGILREGFYDQQMGVAVPDELVAAMYVQPDLDGPRWELDILAARMFLLAGYYGQCTWVVEANNPGMAVMAELRHLGANIWHRTDTDHLNPKGSHGIKKPGFQTNSRTREMWISKLAEAVRDKSLLVRYPAAVRDLETFLINEDGRAEAQNGCFDDWVSALGIGLLIRAFSAASRLHNPENRQSIPPRRTIRTGCAESM